MIMLTTYWPQLIKTILSKILCDLIYDRGFIASLLFIPFITVICLFLGKTLLIEQLQAAQVFTECILHYYTIIMIILWSISYMTRLHSSHELRFWLSLPLSRLQILISLLMVITVITSLIIISSSFCLALLCQTPLTQNLMFVATVFLESIFNVIMIVMICLIARSFMQTTLLISLINIMAYSMPLFISSLQGNWLMATSKFDHVVIGVIKGMTGLLPCLSYPVTTYSALQTPGFTLITSVLCYREYQRKAY